MRIPRLLATPCSAFPLVALLLTGPDPTRAAQMGDYLPLVPGATWSYADPDNPLDTFTDRVFEVIEYEGHPAYRVGQSLDDHVIVYRDRGIITLYASVDEGVLRDLDQDLVLDEVDDGSVFEVCFDTPCDSSLIRVWAELDPSLRSIYGVDPSLSDMMLFASYDPDYSPNLHNVVVESNLPPEAVHPAGAVTGLEWYLRGVGTVILWDVDAASGGLTDHHELVTTTSIGTQSLPIPLVVIASVEPNPFNPRTTIRYHLGQDGPVDVAVYDLSGRCLSVLVRGITQRRGEHSLVWDGRDSQGRAMASGVYLCRVKAGRQVATEKICLLR